MIPYQRCSSLSPILQILLIHPPYTSSLPLHCKAQLAPGLLCSGLFICPLQLHIRHAQPILTESEKRFVNRLPTTAYLLSHLWEKMLREYHCRIWRGLGSKVLVKFQAVHPTPFSAQRRGGNDGLGCQRASFIGSWHPVSFFFFCGSGGSRELSAPISPLSCSLTFHRVEELTGKDPFCLRLLGMILGLRGIQMITFIHHWT